MGVKLLATLTLSCAACVAAVASPAPAQVASQAFSIPASNLKEALDLYSRQADAQLIYRADELADARSPGASGNMSKKAALAALLAGTNFRPIRDSSGAIAIVRAQKTRVNAVVYPAVRWQETAPAKAAEASTAELVGVGEIVVTAQKRATNLQDTPISIAVLGGKDIESRHIVSLENIGSSIPAVQFTNNQGRNSSVQVTIRGIGTAFDVNQPLRDQGVGVYIDSVYLGRAQGLGAALFDIERIEVLKGPQGTLFGRNTEGGAISIVTKKPMGEYSMDTTFGLSNYDGLEARTHVNLPRFGNVSMKIDALVHKRGGTVKNPLLSYPDFNQFHKRGLHVAALWEPSESFDASYGFDTSYDASTPYYTQLTGAGTAPLAPIIRPREDRIKVAEVGLPLRLSIGKAAGHVINLTWKPLPEITLKSISSYRRLKQSQFANNSPTITVFRPNGNFGRDSQARLSQMQYTEELQLIVDRTRLSFIAGAYYFHERLRDDAWSPDTLQWNATGTAYTVLSVPIGRTPFPDRDAYATASSAAVFSQATWTPTFLNDTVHVTGGLRYTYDKKNGTLEKVSGATPTLNGVTAPLRFKDSWSRFDPMVNIAIDLARDAMIYGRWATGYKAGGANSRSLTLRGYGPESVSSFEVGAKTQWLDHRLRLNLAAYTTRISDQQLDFGLFTPGVNRITAETVNGLGTGRIKGAEVELTLVPSRRLTISGAYAYTDADPAEAANPLAAGSVPKSIFPLFTSRHSASGAIDYELPLDGLVLRTHVDVSFSSRQHHSADDPTVIADKSFLMNGLLALEDIKLTQDGVMMRLSIWGRNLLNRSQAIFRTFQPITGATAVFNEPRTYGAQANIVF